MSVAHKLIPLRQNYWMRLLFFLGLFFGVCLKLVAQDPRPITPRERMSLKQIGQKIGDSVGEEVGAEMGDFKNQAQDSLPPITDYLIISHEFDTIAVDTTLNLQKMYRFNNLRKDTFEWLNFSNTGQPYTALSMPLQAPSLFPSLGFRSKFHNMFSREQIQYYRVPTPFTELFFKTVFEQGQSTDAFFTANTSERFNFSIAFKGMRSLGKYQHELAGATNFRFTGNYLSKNQRYSLRFHYVNQANEQQANGGLDAPSVVGFESAEPEFDDRSRLSTKFENAENRLTALRYYTDQQYILAQAKDSIKTPLLTLRHQMTYESTNSFFEQTAAVPEFGALKSGASAPYDRTSLQTLENHFSTKFTNKWLGNMTADAIHYYYSYLIENTTIDTSLPDEQIKANEIALGGRWHWSWKGVALQAKLLTTVIGSRGGDRLELLANIPLAPKWQFNAGFEQINKKPDWVFERLQSSYLAFNWQSQLKNVFRSRLWAKLKSDKWGSLQAELQNIKNYTYFEPYTTIDKEAALLARPKQSDFSIQHLKFVWDKTFRWSHFSIVNKFLFQKVVQQESVLNLPAFVGRLTAAYDNQLFKGAMYLQTGISTRFFTKFYANDFNPLLADFQVQQHTKIGDFPMIDVFVNAKIQRTRIFLIAEHVNSPYTGNNFYAAPTYPYRDFVIRFGVVWNFFQ